MILRSDCDLKLFLCRLNLGVEAPLRVVCPSLHNIAKQGKLVSEINKKQSKSNKATKQQSNKTNYWLTQRAMTTRKKKRTTMTHRLSIDVASFFVFFCHLVVQEHTVGIPASVSDKQYLRRETSIFAGEPSALPSFYLLPSYLRDAAVEALPPQRNSWTESCAKKNLKEKPFKTNYNVQGNNSGF